MNIYLKIPSSRTYYYAKNVTQEIADENKYVKYLIKKKKKHRLAHMGTHLPYGHTVIN